MDSKPRKPKLPRKIPWQGWAMDPLSLPEVKMDAAKRAKPKVTRKVEWRSQDGKTVVVTGPFPRGFFRTDTRSSVAKAA